MGDKMIESNRNEVVPHPDEILIEKIKSANQGHVLEFMSNLDVDQTNPLFEQV
jgi:hypothetical protein